MKNAQKAFNRLVSQDFNSASFDDVKVVALAVWHENFVPVVKGLSDSAKKAAGYLVDKLMRFNCVSNELKKQLGVLLESLKNTVVTSPANMKKKGCEKLAQSWGLVSDLKLQVRQLLEFQTRHYVHN